MNVTSVPSEPKKCPSSAATKPPILGPDGAEIEKHIGIKGADDLAALLKEHLP